MRQLYTTLFLSCLLTTQVAAAGLPEQVAKELKRAHIPLSHVGIVVEQVSKSKPRLSVNANRAVNPASTMKLLTTFAALETLGPAYRWKTEAYLDGTLENGSLNGDLVFKGYGDPKLTVEQFWMWLRELRQRGLHDISGDIVLDHSFFEPDRHDPAEFDNDPTRAYNVGTYALLLNFNALHVHLIPNGLNTTAIVEPELNGYRVVNHITTSAKLPCGGEDHYEEHLDGHNIVLEGSIPASCGETDDYFSLLPHDEYFFAVFSALWKELGGSLRGTYRSGVAPAGQVPFATYVSPPLAEVIRDINKFSNNTMARQLFLALGAANVPDELLIDQPGQARPLSAEDRDAVRDISSIEVPAEVSRAPGQEGGNIPMPDASAVAATTAGQPVPADIARSSKAVRRWLATKSMHFPELVLENGSGLSRKERISCRHLADLLQHAASSPFGSELEASLPILGIDGTVKKRLKGTEMAGYAHLKTGTLEGVKSIAGYVNARSGKRWVVVFIVNHPNAALAQPAQDALIEWLQKKS
jgi:D-alanyl-D-alanine carboxypeptidase/D-alanyl-D-alanine-endopeptidase (penicillin-binding protein 4)